MPTLQVDEFRFHFDSQIRASIYDTSTHYRAVIQNANGGKRAVDVIAVPYGARPEECWAIEAKDYRVLTNAPEDSTPSQMSDDLVRKVQDTKFGCEHAAEHASDSLERALAADFCKAETLHVILHLEPHADRKHRLGRSLLATVQQKLNQLCRELSWKARVLSIPTTAKARAP
jgi:hypothetical protein